MGDEVHQLTGWQALGRKKKKASHRGGAQPVRPGSGGDCPVQGLGALRPSRAGDAQLGAGKAAWGAARGFSRFTIVTAQSGAALARSLRAQGPLETCVTATASHMQLGADFGGRPACCLPPSLPAQLPGTGRLAQLQSLGIPELERGMQRGRAGRLGSWGCPRKRGPRQGGKRGGRPRRQRPGGRLPARLGGLVAAAGSRPNLRHTHFLPLRGGRTAGILAWAEGKLQLFIHETNARLAPPPGCAFYQG